MLLLAVQVVRLFAVLTHPPNMCKEATSCQLIIPAQHCDRKNDVHMFAVRRCVLPLPQGGEWWHGSIWWQGSITIGVIAPYVWK